MKFLIPIIIIYQILATSANIVPCPFNEKECTCTPDPTHPEQNNVFSLVTCKSTGLPSFKALPDQKYNITSFFQFLNGDISKIPAYHFDAFQYICNILFQQNRQSESNVQEWDDHAFDGVQIIGMTVDGLDGFIPAPKAVTSLVDLQYYELRSAPSPAILVDNSFQNMSSLIKLETTGVIIDQVSKNAFSGLYRLGWIYMYNAGISDFSSLTAALKGLRNFTIADLPTNLITEIKTGDLDSLKQLCWLTLDNNPLTDIQQGAFTSELENLQILSFGHTDLETIDLGVFSQIRERSTTADQKQFLLSLDGSQKLKHLTTTVVDKFPHSAHIELWNTGLETIDSKISHLLQNVPDLIIDVSQNTHLKCDALNWMSKIDCPSRMVIQDATCADHDNQPLSEYLKSVDPNSKCQDGPGQAYAIGCSSGNHKTRMIVMDGNEKSKLRK